MRALVLALAACALLGQTQATRAAREFRQDREQSILEEFFRLLRTQDLAGTAELLRAALTARGLDARLLTVDGAAPVVYATRGVPGARQTVLFYAHYDYQPVVAKQWIGHGPFEPILRDKPLEQGGQRISFPEAGSEIDPEWRIYARSSSDDKGSIQAMLTALDALKAAAVTPSVNLKFLFEGEEEDGSRNLGRILAAHKEEAAADMWLICDGPVHQTRRQQIYFGARGVTTLDVTVYGARRELHSGHYGNWAPNPAMRLAQLLASMKSADGRILVKGYLDGIEPLGAAEKRALDEEPVIDEDLKRELWLGSTENAPRRLSELINLPSLNIRGMASGSVGDEARNVIPARATATVDLRLVKGVDWRAAQDKVIEHIRAQGYFVVEAEPDEATLLAHERVAKVARGNGYNAVRTPMDSEASRQVIRAVEAARGATVKMPTLGGSVPLSIIQDVVNVPLIGIPIANHDNSQHAANENLRIRNLWDAIELFASLYTM